MALVETLVLTLGPTIGKHILKHWLKDELSEDLSENLFSLLSEKTSDYLAQRRGERQFEEIGERAVENLLPIFEHGGRSLDEGSRMAVALAVNKTLNQTEITADLLVQKDLSPTDLAAHWRESDIPEVNLFSPQESRLYHRALNQSAIYIVDIASQLPLYSERTFAELLKRDRQLLDKADKVLEQIHRIRQAVGDPDEQAAQFEADYRLAVIRQLDELELFGVNLSSEASRRHRLSVAYVTLLAEQKGPDRGHRLTLFDRLVTVGRLPAHTHSHVTMSVDQALATSNRLLVLGRAGSGKTTLLKWVAVQMANQKLEGPLADWNRLVPFFIRLRQVRNELPRPEEFPGLVASAIAATMPPQWVHNLLKAGQAVVLIDSLDEVPEAQRRDVEKWLKELVETFPKTRFIVTSRRYVEVGWLRRLQFERADLQDMNVVDIDQFIDCWHEAVAVSLREMRRSDHTLPDLAAHLKSEIRLRRPLRNLAVNPLLCAMLCALNRKYRQKLPTMRLELYKTCVNMLLEQRELERSVNLPDYPALRIEDKKGLLCDLAYWMLHHGLSEVSLEKAEECLAESMRAMPNLPSDATASQIRRFFTERSGLVRIPIKGQLDFAHRTFQEYLGAQEAIERGRIEELTNKAHNEDWREVIIVAIGEAPRKVAAKLLTRLMERGDQEPNHRPYLDLLAMASLDVVSRLDDPAIKAKVEERVKQIVPPKNEEESRALANANTRELAVPHLGYRAQYTPKQAELCVKTLSFIGEEAALEKLKSYLGNGGEEVETALLNAWDSFDRSSFIKQIFKPLVRQRTSLLSCARFSSLEGFEQLPHLQHLQLESLGSSTASDLRPLKYLTNLRNLTLSNFTELKDLTPLRELTALTSLSLSGCQQVRNLTPLRKLTALTFFDLSDCQEIRDLTALQEFKSLTHLDLSGCGNIHSLMPLKELIQLKTVKLEGVPKQVIKEFQAVK